VTLARGQARTGAGRIDEALREALASVDAARRESLEPRRVWGELFDGRWHLMEQLEFQGRSLFLVLEISEVMGTAKQRLSRREREVWSLQAQGLANKAIAYSLGLSQAAVVKYLRRARAKLGARQILDALQAACPVPPALDSSVQRRHVASREE
jgi:DNA-binding CsgD family transcriptional regulator